MSDDNGDVGSRFRLSAARAKRALREMGLPIPTPVRVAYHPDYALSFRFGGPRHALDGQRPARIYNRLWEVRLLGSRQVLQPQEPVERDDLLRVHTTEFLDEISKPQQMAQLLFMTDLALADPDPLRPFLLQAAGTVAAVERCLEDRVPSVNLGGGFHHASVDKAHGFCPINDVAVAIQRVRRRGLVQRVLVVDLDYHQGDGTALIFADDDDVFTLSVHGQTLVRIGDKCRNIDLELPPGTGDEPYLAAVRATVTRALDEFTPELCLYVAGADVHTDDALGDFAVSEDGVLQRDLFVHRTMRQAEVPLAVVLAGGYGPLAWTLPYNFVYSLITGAPIHRAVRPGNIELTYRRVKESLTTAELRAGEESLSEEDIESMLRQRCDGGLFMEAYSQDGLRIALERYGFLNLLRDKGFANLIVSIDTSDRQRQVASVHFDARDRQHLLIELAVTFRTVETPQEAVDEGMEASYRMLSIEWLLMQNPAVSFSQQRRQFPGQQHPGLGLGRHFVELLRMMAERLECVGLMNNPQHYHNAYLYSKQMLYFSPDDQGLLEALKRDLGHLPLVETSLAIDRGKLRDASNGKPFNWEGRPQVMPVLPPLRSYFARPSYIRAVAEARDRYRFVLEP